MCVRCARLCGHILSLLASLCRPPPYVSLSYYNIITVIWNTGYDFVFEFEFLIFYVNLISTYFNTYVKYILILF